MMLKLKWCLGAGVLCTLCVLSGCRPTTSWNWERAEAGLPRQVVILALAADPVNPNRLWVGYYAPDGIAVSHDGGQTWTTGARGLRDNPVFDLLPLSGDVLWAATRDGLMRSTDGGASWNLEAAERLPSAATFALAANALEQVYVGLDNAGLYLSSPEGDTWERLAYDKTLSKSTVLSLAVSLDGRFIYAGTAGHGLYASQDAGHTWTRAFPDDYVANLAINPSHPMMAVASLRDRLVHTRDGGHSWQKLSAPWAQDEVVSLLWIADTVTGSLPQMEATGTLLAGSGQGQVYCSQDGGESWGEIGDRVSTQGGVLALTTAGNRLLAGTWTGVYASPAESAIGPQARLSQCGDLSPSWTYLSPSLGIPHSNALLNAGSRLLLGTRAGLFHWQPTTRHWVPVPLTASQSPAAHPGSVAALATATSNEKVAYAGTPSGELYRSDDGGADWLRVPSNLDIGIRALAVSPVDADRVYMLAAWERVYESRDGGKNWKGHWTGLGVTTEAISLAIDPAEPSTIYLGTDSGLFRSLYGGGDWRPVGHQLDGQTVLSLVAHSARDSEDEHSILYIGATRGAYLSRDGGDTIESWGQGLEGVSVTEILLDPNDSRNVYVGTAYAGLYRSVDQGETWQPIGPPKLSEEIVEMMTLSSEGELFVASSGGLWVGRRE